MLGAGVLCKRGRGMEKVRLRSGWWPALTLTCPADINHWRIRDYVKITSLEHLFKRLRCPYRCNGNVLSVVRDSLGCERRSNVVLFPSQTLSMAYLTGMLSR